MFHIDAKQGKPFTKAIALTFTYLFLVILSFLVLFPFYWMLNVSLTTVNGFESATPLLFSDNLIDGFSNYYNTFSIFNLGRYFVNTLIFSVITTLFMVIITVLTAFAFARLEFKGKKIVIISFLLLSMVPTEVLVIGNYASIELFGLTSTFIGLIVPSIFNVLYVYILYKSFKRTPNQLYYQAKIDGMSDFTILKNVYIPMHRKTIIAILILKLLECWNSYVWPSVIADNEDYHTLTTALQSLRGVNTAPIIMVIVICITLPAIILFLIFKDKIYSGVKRAVSSEE